MYVSRKKANGRQHSGVERSLEFCLDYMRYHDRPAQCCSPGMPRKLISTKVTRDFYQILLTRCPPRHIPVAANHRFSFSGSSIAFVMGTYPRCDHCNSSVSREDRLKLLRPSSMIVMGLILQAPSMYTYFIVPIDFLFDLKNPIRYAHKFDMYICESWEYL